MIPLPQVTVIHRIALRKNPPPPIFFRWKPFSHLLLDPHLLCSCETHTLPWEAVKGPVVASRQTPDTALLLSRLHVYDTDGRRGDRITYVPVDPPPMLLRLTSPRNGISLGISLGIQSLPKSLPLLTKAAADCATATHVRTAAATQINTSAEKTRFKLTQRYSLAQKNCIFFY